MHGRGARWLGVTVAVQEIPVIPCMVTWFVVETLIAWAVTSEGQARPSTRTGSRTTPVTVASSLEGQVAMKRGRDNVTGEVVSC